MIPFSLLRSRLGLISTFALIVGASAVHAGEPAAHRSTRLRPASTEAPSASDTHSKDHCRITAAWCPDRYRSKCPPRLCPPQWCGGGCYTPKCEPHLVLPNLCGGGCYIPKCLPRLTIPCNFPPFYRCPPSDCLRDK